MNSYINTLTFELELYDVNNIIHNEVLNKLWKNEDTKKYLYNKEEFINNILDRNGEYNSIYIVSLNNTYIGFISLYFYDNTYEVSDGILQEFRGRGYATKLLKEFCEYVFNNTSIKELYGYIDKDNISSIKSAIKSGFINTDNKEYVITKNFLK